MIYLKLFAVFFKIGAVIFGGGYAMIPLIQEAVVKNGWCTTAEFANIVTIAQITPGPLGLNTATYAGKATAGIAGGLVSSLGLIIPGLIITSLFFHYINKHLERSKHLRSIIRGIRSAAIGLIFIAVLFFAEHSIFNHPITIKGLPNTTISIPAIGIFLLTIYLSKKKNLSPIICILIGGLLAILVY